MELDVGRDWGMLWLRGAGRGLWPAENSSVMAALRGREGQEQQSEGSQARGTGAADSGRCWLERMTF